MPVISTPGRLSQEDFDLEASLHIMRSCFIKPNQNNLDYIAKICLKTKTKNKTKPTTRRSKENMSGLHLLTKRKLLSSQHGPPEQIMFNTCFVLLLLICFFGSTGV
jgi:hypothetical protein